MRPLFCDGKDSCKHSVNVEKIAFHNYAISFADFRELFPQRDLSADKITVITLSQRTQNDMSMWNAEVDEEREILLENVGLNVKNFAKGT